MLTETQPVMLDRKTVEAIVLNPVQESKFQVAMVPECLDADLAGCTHSIYLVNIPAILDDLHEEHLMEWYAIAIRFAYGAMHVQSFDVQLNLASYRWRFSS